MVPPPRRRWIRVLRVVAPVVLLLAIPAGWLALRRIPAWYHPIAVPETDFDRVRDDLTRTFAEVSDGLAANRPFAVSISGRRLNEWLVARAEIWPESAGWVPDWIQQPFVQIEDGRVRLAGLVDHDGWKGIVSLRLAAVLDADDLVLHLTSVTIGAMPLPTRLWRWTADRFADQRGPAGSAPDHNTRLDDDIRAILSEGLRVRGPFVWENGKRTFTVEAVDATDDVLTLTLRPR